MHFTHELNLNSNVWIRTKRIRQSELKIPHKRACFNYLKLKQ